MILASDPHKRARIISVIACTTISLACGTNVCLTPELQDMATANHVLSMDTQYGVQVSQPASDCLPPIVTSLYETERTSRD